MKTCTYCGGKYSDDTTECPVDGNPVSDKPAAAPPEQPDWVTVVTCGTMVTADLAAAKMRAAGMAVFIPDEILMQTFAFNVNTFGYIRVQVSPEDCEAAKALLAADGQDG
jgi:hypothetical protein